MLLSVRAVLAVRWLWRLELPGSVKYIWWISIRVSNHNIHRQIAFTLEDEGKNKAKAVCNLIKSKNPFVKAVAFDMPFDDFKEMGNHYDLILDATDNLPVRGEIDTYAKAGKTPWIYASVEEFNGQVCFFEEANFQVFNISDHKPGGIAAPIVMHIGSLQANLALALSGRAFCNERQTLLSLF